MKLKESEVAWRGVAWRGVVWRGVAVSEVTARDCLFVCSFVVRSFVCATVCRVSSCRVGRCTLTNVLSSQRWYESWLVGWCSTPSQARQGHAKSRHVTHDLQETRVLGHTWIDHACSLARSTTSG